MSILTTLADLVRGTTREEIIRRSLDRIDGTLEAEYGRIRLQLQGRLRPDITSTLDYPTSEAIRCIDALLGIRPGGLEAANKEQETSAKQTLALAHSFEAEARCRIKEVVG